jgi:predicted transcriptional regulator
VLGSHPVLLSTADLEDSHPTRGGVTPHTTDGVDCFYTCVGVGGGQDDVIRKVVGGRRVGELEEAILAVLFAADEPLFVRQVAERLPGTPRAYTTVATVLGRLVDKGLVARSGDERGYRFAAAGDPDELTAEAIRRLIASAQDPTAVLAHFVDALDDEGLKAELRALLGEDGRE